MIIAILCAFIMSLIVYRLLNKKIEAITITTMPISAVSETKTTNDVKTGVISRDDKTQWEIEQRHIKQKEIDKIFKGKKTGINYECN